MLVLLLQNVLNLITRKIPKYGKQNVEIDTKESGRGDELYI